MKISNFFTICLLITLFVSCNNADKKAEPSDSSGSKKTTSENKINDDTTVLKNIIIDYYTKDFQKTKSGEPQSQFKIDTTEDGIELKVNDDTTLISGQLNTIPFSKDFVRGDLNGDKVDDILIPVYSTGGGTAEWREIFLFISNNGKLDFFKMYSSFELGICKIKGSNDGQFYPDKIENGVLVGETASYLKDDGHCCPSIKCSTQYKFDKGLTFLNQTRIK